MPPLLGALVTVIGTKLAESRSRLLTYYGHVASFMVHPSPPPDVKPFRVNTHAVVVKNAGKKATTNLRLSHRVLPKNVEVWPPRQYTTEPVPGAEPEIVFPLVGPGEQFTVSYLYFPPLTFNQINNGIRSDDGPARQVQMQLQLQNPNWMKVLAVCLTVTGFVVTLAAVLWAFRAAYQHWF